MNVKAYISKLGEVWVCVDDLLKSFWGKKSIITTPVMTYLEKLRDKILNEKTVR